MYVDIRDVSPIPGKYDLPCSPGTDGSDQEPCFSGTDRSGKEPSSSFSVHITILVLCHSSKEVLKTDKNLERCSIIFPVRNEKH